MLTDPAVASMCSFILDTLAERELQRLDEIEYAVVHKAELVEKYTLGRKHQWQYFRDEMNQCR